VGSKKGKNDFLPHKNTVSATLRKALLDKTGGSGLDSLPPVCCTFNALPNQCGRIMDCVLEQVLFRFD
jgi:hypothetical protein